MIHGFPLQEKIMVVLREIFTSFVEQKYSERFDTTFDLFFPSLVESEAVLSPSGRVRGCK